jgi:dihydrofolate synthase/folylpolyglutamate synthase
MRPGISTVCGDPMPPRSISLQARILGAPLYNIGDAYRFDEQASSWSWYGPQSQWIDLPRPAIEGNKQLQNAATVLMGLSLLNEQLPVDFQAIRSGLRNAILPGRFQRIHGEVETILDIAHNPEAAIALANTLKDQPIVGRTHAVFAVLSDKDAVGIVRAMQECVDSWYLTQVDSTRALPVFELIDSTLSNMPELRVTHFPDTIHAYREACRVAEIGDRILVFGSVLTVAAVLDLFIKTEENTAALSMEKL